MKEHLYKTRGFTYIELLIVVGIMLIFGAFLVASVNPVERIKAQRDSQRESDLNSILLSVQQKIKNDRGWDCPSEPLPQDKFTTIGTGSGEYDLYSCLLPNYLSKYLVDPKEGSITGRDITDGLVGHWKFDEGSGTTAYDASGNGNDGTLVNGPAWVDGKMGRALDFNGSSNYVDAGNDASLNITDAITIEAWVYKNPGGQCCQRIAQKGNTNQAYGLLFEETTTLKARFYLGADKVFTLQGNFETGKWKHVAMTYDSHYVKGYVDGINVYTSTDQNSAIGTIGDNLQIGRRGDASFATYFNGLIDDVRIYNRALSPEEIQDLYNYEYLSKYAIWQNPVTKNISLKSLEDETKEVSTGAPELALDFDGSNDYVNVPNDASLNITDAITIEAWVKAPVTLPPAYTYIVMKYPGTGVWGLRYNTDGKVSFVVRNIDGVERAASSVTKINDDTFHHIVGVRDFSAGKLYVFVDGIKEGINTDPTGSMSNNSSVKIGYWPGDPNYFNGTIDDVRIYNRALSAEEVEQLYKGYDIRNGIVGHWPLNEGQGETAYDRSGNGNNGTLLPAGNGPTWTTK